MLVFRGTRVIRLADAGAWCALGVYIETFWTNPQYRVTVVDADEGDADNTGTLIVALLQKERRANNSRRLQFLTIGYSVYKVSYQRSSL